MKPRRWQIVLVLLLLVFAAHSTLYHFFAVDDAFISFRYARNWAEGLGPVYNPGEHVDGYTNFLWVVLLTGTALAKFDVPFIAGWLGTWFGTLAVALAMWLVRRHPLGQSLAAGAIAALALGLNAIFNRSMVEGLETAQFTFLLLATMARLWVETTHPRDRWPLGGLLAAMLTLTRPDGALFIPLVGGWAIWRLWRHGAPRPLIARWTAGFVLTSGVIAGAWFAWHWAFYGAPLANTFYAKTGGPFDIRLARGLDSLDTLWESSGSVILLAAAILGCLFLARQAEWWSLVLLGIAGRVAFHLYSGGSFIGFLRFLIPTIPLLAAVAAVCIGALWREARSGRRLAMLPAGAMIAVLTVTAMDLPRVTRWYASSRHAMQTLTQGHIALGKHLAVTAQPGAIIAIQDAGAVPYFSGLVTIDIVGLNDAHIAHLEGDLYQKTDVDYVLNRQPTYIILVSNTDPAKQFTPAKWVDIAFYENPRFQATFTHTATFMADPSYYLTVFTHNQVQSP